MENCKTEINPTGHKVANKETKKKNALTYFNLSSSDRHLLQRHKPVRRKKNPNPTQRETSAQVQHTRSSFVPIKE